MSDIKILAWLLCIVAVCSGVSIVAGLNYLRLLRERIGQHRNVRNRL